MTSIDNGVPDYLTELEPADDAATYYWGPKWTMPTKEQFQELVDNCDWTRVNDYYSSLVGWMVQSRKNKNNIFFPFTNYYHATADGQASKDPANGKGNDGYYWTKNLSGSDDHAVLFHTEAHGYNFDMMLRFLGCPIRPVRRY